MKHKGGLPLSLTIPSQLIADTLVSAFEGGSNYWYRIEENETNKHPADGALTAGGITVSDYVAAQEERNPKPKTERLNIDAIVKGLKVMAEDHARHFGDMISEQGDAETADVFLQCCLFGEVIYG